MLNAAQQLYIPWAQASAKGQMMGRLKSFRPGTPPRKHFPNVVRGPKGFDLSAIKNPEKYLNSHARKMLAVKAVCATPRTAAPEAPTKPSRTRKKVAA